MVGGLLSSLFPEIGPAVVQLPSLSQIDRVAVAPFAVSVPAETLVVRENDASTAFASPLWLSLAVQRIDTSRLCQAPSGAPHVMSGGAISVAGISLNPRGGP